MGGRVTVPGAIHTPWREAPAGVQDGVNAIFTLTYAPIQNSENVYVNGQIQIPGIHYSISGNVITFATPPRPATGAPGTTHQLWCSYLY